MRYITCVTSHALQGGFLSTFQSSPKSSTSALGRQVSLQDVHAPFDLENDLLSLSPLSLELYSKSSQVFFYQRKITNKLK